MAHYYDYDPSLSKEEFPVSFELEGKTYLLHSSAGVFSSRKPDTGSMILARTIADQGGVSGQVLDLGCGIGILGVAASAMDADSVTGIDVNEQACSLAAKNYSANKVSGEILCQDHIDSKMYDVIILNPPIRAGKAVIYSLFDQAYDHLKPGGILWIVIRKQHGAKSAAAHLEQRGFQVIRVSRDLGFWVLKAKKPE